MHPILYILQNDYSAFRQKIDIPLLEILYHFYSCFDPNVIYPQQKSNEKSVFAKAMNKKGDVPLRHSRFLPHFMKKNARGVRKLTYKIESSETEEKPFKGQRQTPFKMADYKKVIPLEL